MREFGGEVRTFEANLVTYDGAELLSLAIEGAERPLDAIASNAGVGLGGAFVGGTDLHAELERLQLNVASAVHPAKRVLPGLVARGRGGSVHQLRSRR